MVTVYWVPYLVKSNSGHPGAENTVTWSQDKRWGSEWGRYSLKWQREVIEDSSHFQNQEQGPAHNQDRAFAVNTHSFVNTPHEGTI